jgi:hypothetical protein
MSNAQGVVFYLLALCLIGVGVGGIFIILNFQDNENIREGNVKEGLLNSLKYNQLGFNMEFFPMRHDSFKLPLKPFDNSLSKVFSVFPLGTKIRVNFGEWYDKTGEVEWANGGNKVLLNPNDIIDVSIPSGGDKVKLNIMGDYVPEKQNTVTLVCPPNKGTAEITIPFKPNILDPEIAFLGFTYGGRRIVEGDMIKVTKPSGCTFSYYYQSECTGKVDKNCENIVDSSSCNSFPLACVWQNKQCLTKESSCDKLFTESFTKEQCVGYGCKYNQPFLHRQSSCTNPLLGQGDLIELKCVSNYKESFVFEDSYNSNEGMDSVLIPDDGKFYNPIQIRNYSCYTIEKILQKFSFMADENYFLEVTCYRGNEKVTVSSKENQFNKDLSYEIFKDTVCLVNATGLNPGNINFTC